MGILRKNKPTITSAHSPVSSNDGKTQKNLITQRSDGWQDKTLLYADAIPEVAAASSFIRNTISNVEYIVEIPGSEENEVLKKTEDTITDWLRGFTAGRSAEHIFLIGETIIGYQAEGTDVTWRSYSMQEVEYNKNNKLYAIRNEEGKFEPAPPELKLFRVYTPDRINRYNAYSNHKACVDTLESLFLHQLVDQAIAQSRLAGSGLFIIPDDGFDVAGRDENGHYPEGSLGAIMEQIASSMTASIQNRRSNEAYVPFMLATSGESIDKFRHMMLERNDDAAAYETRIDAYRKRYASGIDLPQEIILGVNDANHWTAWKIDDNTWQYHLLPLAHLISEALLANFVEPVAEALGYMGEINITIDGTAVIAKPDKTETIINLAKLDRITNEGIADLLSIPLEYVKNSEQIGMNPFDQLSIGRAQSNPVTAAIKKKISSIPQRIAALDHRLNNGMRRLLVERIPRIVKARLETVKAASFDEELDLLLKDVRRISERDILARLAVIEAAIGITSGQLRARYQVETAARGDRLASVIASYAGFVSNQERLLQQSTGDKTPSSSIRSKYTPHIGVLRAAVDIQNGGAGTLTENYMTMIVRPSDVNSDPLINEPLNEAQIERRATYVWLYGDESTRKQPYEPHVELDGETWASAQESDALNNDGTTPAGVWFPGDHDGCQCEYDIIWE